jgi:hypothetical protein
MQKGVWKHLLRMEYMRVFSVAAQYDAWAINGTVPESSCNIFRTGEERQRESSSSGGVGGVVTGGGGIGMNGLVLQNAEGGERLEKGW